MDNSTDKDRHPGKNYPSKANKVQKGFIVAYPTQSSIPFKNQISAIPEPEKKGFNSQARRFYYKKLLESSPTCWARPGALVLLVLLSVSWPAPFSLVISPHSVPKIIITYKDNIPGPEFYDVIHQSPVFNTVSLSKKGTCTFSSMSPRFDTIISKYPAANAYTIPSRFVSKKDFSNSCSSMFQLPSFVKVLKSETPAPNHYNLPPAAIWRMDHSVGEEWLLKNQFEGSYTNRREVRAWSRKVITEVLGHCTFAIPETGHYNINESLVKQSPKALMSCFKSKTGRGLKLTSTGPGPGYYNPSDHIKILKKALFLRNPILNFSAQPLSLPPKPPLPGPGHYEIVDYAGPPRHFISSASFVSSTGRWTAAPSEPDLPGPAMYNPELPGKQSFLFNGDNKWIPVL